MNFPTTVVLGAIAGFTIYLGLPVARLKKLAPALQAFLNAVAIGILLFLLWDILSKASEPIENAIADAQKGMQAVLFCCFCYLRAVFVWDR